VIAGIAENEVVLDPRIGVRRSRLREVLGGDDDRTEPGGPDGDPNPPAAGGQRFPHRASRRGGVGCDVGILI
jgi:hypothetical protein